jgi:hypothetical protein
MMSFFQAYIPQTFKISGTPTFTLQATKFLETTDNDGGVDNDGWFGRQSVLVRKNGLVIRTFKEGKAHNNEAYGGIYVSVSQDYGQTWSAQGYYHDGTAITGLPMRAAGSGNAFGNTRGPSEGTLIACPNGDMLCVMWDSNYGTGQPTNNNGAWLQRSTDEGRSWGTATKVSWVTSGIMTDNNECFFTEGYVVVDGVIYTQVRKITSHSPYTEEMYFATSSNNGTTWTIISQMNYAANAPASSGEGSLAWLGEGRLVSTHRGSRNSNGYYQYSNDMGLTWSAMTDITAAMGIGATSWLGRTTMYTRGKLMRKVNGETDRMLIIFGFTGGVDNESAGARRNFISYAIVPEDYNLANVTFYPVTYVDDAGHDGGYGDGFYDPLRDEYVFLSYRSPTSLYDGSTKQYNVKLTYE